MSLHADLVTSTIVESDLMLQICSSQEVATSELKFQLKKIANYREHSFFCLECFFLSYHKKGYTIVSTKDKELRWKLLHWHKDLLLAGFFNMFQNYNIKFILYLK